MKHLLAKTVLLSGLPILGVTANAQYQPRDDYYGSRDTGRERYASRLLDRVRGDLEQAESSRVPLVGEFNGDRQRIGQALREVSEFQQSLSYGDNNPRRLDVAIASVQRVLDENSLSYRARNVLADDLNRMRAFRARQAR
jgi:hypothetical protein